MLRFWAPNICRGLTPLDDASCPVWHGRLNTELTTNTVQNVKQWTTKLHRSVQIPQKDGTTTVERYMTSKTSNRQRVMSTADTGDVTSPIVFAQVWVCSAGIPHDSRAYENRTKNVPAGITGTGTNMGGSRYHKTVNVHLSTITSAAFSHMCVGN